MSCGTSRSASRSLAPPRRTAPRRSRCPSFTYRGSFQGGAQIADAEGNVLALREARDGSGFVIAEVEAQRSEPVEEVPDRFWLHPRGAVATWAWQVQRILGRRWYRRHIRGRPPMAVG